MTLIRHLACALALVVLAGCGGSTSPQTEETNVWICVGGGCVLPGRCADIQGGGAMSCAAGGGWNAVPAGACSPADCTAIVDSSNPCMAVVSCPTR